MLTRNYDGWVYVIPFKRLHNYGTKSVAHGYINYFDLAIFSIAMEQMTGGYPQSTHQKT